MSRSAPKETTRSPWLHAGRCFGDVLVGMDADYELNWMFNRAGEQIEQPSNMTAADREAFREAMNRRLPLRAA